MMLIIITDAHVSAANGNQEEFMAMVQALEAYPGQIVFLGDIFDLWIGLSRYEEAIQRDFVDWCRRRHGVGFVEGNHEFYVVARHASAFGWSSTWGRRIGQLLFVHGDLVNREDRKYLRWRRLSKNGAMRLIVRLLPFGTRIVQHVKAKMKKTNMAFRMTLPEAALVQFCRERAAEGVRQIFVGHFHQAFQCEQQGCRLNILPDWFSSGAISVYDQVSGELRSQHWREICSSLQNSQGSDENA